MKQKIESEKSLMKKELDRLDQLFEIAELLQIDPRELIDSNKIK